MGTSKNTPKKASIATDKRLKVKKPIITSKKAVKPRFFEIKVRITANEYAWGLPYFGEQKYLSKFVLESYREKIKRAEAHDKEARQRNLSGNIELLVTLLKEAYARGELDFLREMING